VKKVYKSVYLILIYYLLFNGDLLTYLIECLKSLVFETLESRQIQIRSASDNTCRWLYDLPTFQNWYDRKPGFENSMLWIKGKPGCGKSVLVKSLMETINRDRVLVGSGLVSEVLGSADAVGSFFFHARRRRTYEYDAKGLYRTLVYQLFKQDPFLRERVLAAYELKTRTGEEWQDHELENLFVETYLGDEVNLPLKRVFIFVDAVDECLPRSWYSVVRCLSKLAQKTEFNVCLSSRYYPNIPAPNIIEVIVEDHNRPDILHYVQSELSLACPYRDMMVQAISNKASGLFQWVSIVLPLLNEAIDNGEPSPVVSKILEDVPGELGNLYNTLLKTLSNEQQEKALLIAQWILFAGRPLTLADLHYALALCPCIYRSLQDVWVRAT
jgi:hypothetical protein